MEQKINRITDILRRDDGISGAMMYTEQISWVLFLKFLNDYEIEKAESAELDGLSYTNILDETYRWDVWACPKKEGKNDTLHAQSGDDLLKFVNEKLFPYLQGFKSISEDAKSVKYKIGAIFEFITNRIAYHKTETFFTTTNKFLIWEIYNEISNPLETC